jgi:hypothetical protein
VCCVCATSTAATKTNPPKWSAAIAPAVAIPAAMALVAVNRLMNVKCSSAWMTDRTLQRMLHLTSRRLLIYRIIFSVLLPVVVRMSATGGAPVK